MTDPRDALYAKVRKLCGDKAVIKSILMEGLALVEFPNHIVLIHVRGNRMRSLRLSNRQAQALTRQLSLIYDC